jgi:hypothetical protein
MNGQNPCVFSSDGVFGNHRPQRGETSWWFGIYPIFARIIIVWCVRRSPK